MKRVVKLNEFMSACIQLLEGSNSIIHRVRKLSSFANIAMQKGQSASDVFTEVDVHIQNTVMYNLSQLYPRATIIGEEDEVTGMVHTGRPFIEPDQLTKNSISQKMLMNNYHR